MKLTAKPLYLLAILLLSALHAGADERLFREYKSSDGLADNSVQSIVCTKTGRMAISTLGNINFYEGVTFSYINMDAETVFPLSNYSGNPHIYFDAFHHLWLKSRKGVQCIDLLMERPVSNVDSVLQTLGADGRVDDLFTDNTGEAWMVIGDKLLGCRCRKQFPVLDGLNLQDVDVYNNHLLMFYDNGEMTEYDLAGGKTVYRGRAYDESESGRYNRSSVIRQHGNGYYQIRNGKKESILMRLNMDNHQWTTILQTDYHMNNMDVYDGVLYVASEWGYWMYDIGTGNLTHKKEIKLRDGRLLTTEVNTVAFDKQGGMWLGTEERGLLYSRKLAIPFKTYPLSDPLAKPYAQYLDTSHTNKVITEYNGKKANCMFVDSHNHTWVGTTKGLEYYVTSQSEPYHISTRNGLLNNVIHSIVEDNLHNIWVSTSYGIACVVMKGDSIRYTMSYNDIYDDIPNETFVNGKAAKMQDGTILMQTLDHVVVFHPERFRMLRGKVPFKIYPKLIRVMVNGNIVEPGKKYEGTLILKKAISRVDTINVNYDQNSLSLLFCGLNYIRPLQTYYKFRVLGYSDKWQMLSYYNSNGKVDVDGLLHLPLNSLQPGSYQIDLQVSMNPDVWEAEPISWYIVVHEPWWRARGMLSLLGLVLVVLTVINFVVYNSNTRLKMKRNTEEGDIVRRVRNFIERCDGFRGEMFAPSFKEIFNDGSEQRSVLSDEFLDVMIDIVPYVHRLNGGELSMHNMSQLTGVDLQQLYEIMSANLYKNPRSLARTLRLHKGAKLLTTTDLSIERIAAECGFLSPNYFIANFYHRFKQTPVEYRAKRKKGPQAP